jgi:hypothetical protein
MTNDEFEILISSDRDYETLLCEIYYKENFVAQVSREDGPDAIRIEFFEWTAQSPGEPLRVPFDGFQECLERAKVEVLKKGEWESSASNDA